jgi:hypothetical protein
LMLGQLIYKRSNKDCSAQPQRFWGFRSGSRDRAVALV